MQRRTFLSITFNAFIIPVILGLIAGSNSLMGNTSHLDFISIDIASHFTTLITQPLLSLYIAWQVASYRKITPLIKIRKQKNVIQIMLLRLILAESLCYFIIFYSMFLFSGIRWFMDGNAILGIAIMLLHMVVICGLNMALIVLLDYKYGTSIIFSILILPMLYHYIIEMQSLLIMYSPVFDPLYRAIHEIYR